MLALCDTIYIVAENYKDKWPVTPSEITPKEDRNRFPKNIFGVRVMRNYTGETEFDVEIDRDEPYAGLLVKTLTSEKSGFKKEDDEKSEKIHLVKPRKSPVASFGNSTLWQPFP